MVVGRPRLTNGWNSLAVASACLLPGEGHLIFHSVFQGLLILFRRPPKNYLASSNCITHARQRRNVSARVAPENAEIRIHFYGDTPAVVGKAKAARGVGRQGRQDLRKSHRG